jgi:hypothetical protein
LDLGADGFRVDMAFSAMGNDPENHLTRQDVTDNYFHHFYHQRSICPQTFDPG